MSAGSDEQSGTALGSGAATLAVSAQQPIGLHVRSPQAPLTADGKPALAIAASRPIGLYVHFPWCVRKCPYCDFNSHPLRGSLAEADYVEALLLDLRRELERFDGRRVATVFFGGGTPSLFAPASFGRLLSAVPGTPAEATLEANPGAAEHGDFAAYRRAGITRVSLGAQTFDDAQLARLGRIHSAEDTRRAARALAGAGFESFNLDVMYGLPGQSVAAALADLEEAVRLGPPHISWYQLAIESKTEFAARPPPGLPTTDQAAGIEEAGVELLARHGYRRYEVSAFARDGHRCRHNLNYWRFGDYAGIGAGAHGKATTPAGIHRTAKPAPPRLYLRGDPATVLAVPPAERAAEFMMNALRLVDGVAARRFVEGTGLPWATVQATVAELESWGLVRPGRLALTPRGLRQLDAVVARF